MSELAFEAHDEADTDRLAAALAEALEPGTAVELNGTLGAGKTRLVRGIACALAIDPRDVASPTFTLVHEYTGRRRVFHFDAYRVGSSQEFADLGCDEYFSAGGLSFIEWGERVADCLPDERVTIGVEVVSPESRRFTIRAVGETNERAIERVATALGASTDTR